MKNLRICLSVLLAFLMAVSCCTVAFADTTATYESESNDTAETANAVALANYGQGSLSTDTDVDWYSFDTTSAGQGLAKVTFAANAGGSSSVYFNVTVYAADKTTVEASLAVKGSSSSTTSDAFDVPAGLHYVKIAAGNVYSQNIYKISMAVTVPTYNEVETNDTWAKSVSNTISTSAGYNSKWFHGMISSTTDVDYFQITASAGYIIAEIKQSEGTTGDYKLQVITLESGTENVIGEVSITEDATTYVSTSEIGVAKGTYYLRVSGTVGGYELRYYTNTSLKSETEINNTFAKANVYTLGTSEFYGSMGYTGDVDYYKVVSDGSNYKITVAAATSSSTTSVTWNVYLFDSSYKQQASGTVTGSQTVEFNMGDYDSGTYYVQISSGTIYGTGNYKITSSKYEASSSTSLWDQIKNMGWGTWFKTNFGQMLMMLGGSDNRIDLNGDGNYDINTGLGSLLYSLWNLSVGTLVKYFTSD